MEENKTTYRMINVEKNIWQCENCLHLAQFEADGPFENLWDYCPYCGRKIEGDNVSL